MSGTEWIDFWWLIPLVMIGLCLFGGIGCCSGRRHRLDRSERESEPGSDSALEILSRRYASGEIEEEEFERKRRTINQAKKERSDDDGKNRPEE